MLSLIEDICLWPRMKSIEDKSINQPEQKLQHQMHKLKNRQIKLAVATSKFILIK